MNAVRSVVFSFLVYIWFVLVAVGCTPLLLMSDGVILGMFRVWATGINILLRVCCNVRVEVRGPSPSTASRPRMARYLEYSTTIKRVALGDRHQWRGFSTAVGTA